LATEPQRIAVVAALGKQRSCSVSKLLADPSPRVVLESARVIWDVPLPRAYANLAMLADEPRATSEPLLRRAIAAALADGAPASLEAVVRCGLRADLTPAIREFAWAAVRQWAQPSPRDPVHGQWRPVEPRPAGRVVAVLRQLWPVISDTAAVDRTGVVVAAELGLPEALAALVEIVDSNESPPALRARAVEALATAQETDALHAIESALGSSSVDLRLAGRRLLVRRFPERAVEALRAALESSTIPEQQEALAMLGRSDAPEAREAIGAWMTRVEQGACPPELVLDVLETAAAADDAELVARQAEYRQQQAAAGPAAEFAMCLEGGDAARGLEVYSTNAALSCKRCHALKPDVTMVGPSLSDIGAKRTRAEILESIVQPNAKITEGFQTTSLLLETGLAVAGILRREDDQHAVLVDPEGKEVVVEVASIEERSQGLSAMPDGLMQHMTPRDLRNLVAFLSMQKTAAAASSGPALVPAGYGDGAADGPPK
jgi:quinoprotein glucose dehydrogenase